MSARGRQSAERLLHLFGRNTQIVDGPAHQELGQNGSRGNGGRTALGAESGLRDALRLDSKVYLQHSARHRISGLPNGIGIVERPHISGIPEVVERKFGVLIGHRPILIVDVVECVTRGRERHSMVDLEKSFLRVDKIRPALGRKLGPIRHHDRIFGTGLDAHATENTS